MPLSRTPEERFEAADLTGYEYDPEYVEVGEPRMAYVDVEGEGEETFLCLHGEPTWGYLYRKMIPALREEGRVVVPDFVGFGRSDKYTEVSEYSFDLFYDFLVEFVTELDLRNVTLLCQDWGSILGLPAAAHNEERFSRIVAMNALIPDGRVELSEAFYGWQETVVEQFAPAPAEWDVGQMLVDGVGFDPNTTEAYNAPFPDAGSKAGAIAWPQLVPDDPAMDGADTIHAARERFAEWEDPFFVLFSDSDPITRNFADDLRELVPAASEQPETWIEDAGHFLQETAGEKVANEVVKFVRRT